MNSDYLRTNVSSLFKLLLCKQPILILEFPMCIAPIEIAEQPATGHVKPV